jgi:hypothetical protein
MDAVYRKDRIEHTAFNADNVEYYGNMVNSLKVPRINGKITGLTVHVISVRALLGIFRMISH